ncbi:phospholipase D-like domain-containing protein [Alkalicoccus luteus]|uniref:phospholipase D-like domain-containing protein n=1 Tax=Alkalicoccus luteus TaxID=1237094 RepID=UPI0040334B7D
MKHKKWLWIGLAFAALYIGVTAWHQLKPLPEGIDYTGDVHMLQEDEAVFLADLTYQNEAGEVYEHEIMEEMFRVIDEAEHFLIIDMFMVNEFSDESRSFPELSREFGDRIEQRMAESPDLKAVFITDPINTTYFSHEAAHIDRLADAGVEVIYTNLERLRDPNPIYSSFWRIGFQWFGQRGPAWLPNAFGPSAPDVTLRSYLKLANIKANHRKLVMNEEEAVITSANPHDASGFHSNIGIRVSGSILKELVDQERAVAAFSDGDLDAFPTSEELDEWVTIREEGPIQAQLVTEQSIRQAALKILERAEQGDTVWLGMFYLSDRYIIEGLHEAADRGVQIQAVLDPNQNAFGQEKIGLPNIPVASELVDREDGLITVRWYDTYEEQYHSKLLYADRGEQVNILAGSTNFTERNLNNYNLENNISLTAPADSQLAEDVDAYFERIWNNEDETFTVAYEEYEGAVTPYLYGLYVLQKSLRFTTY